MVKYNRFLKNRWKYRRGNAMSFMIVSDSSSNVLSMGSSNYTTVPLKIIAEKEYVDDAALDLAGMMEDLRNQIGRAHV